MKNHLESAFRFRHHAEELRLIAENVVDPRSKETLLRLAEEYDRMAESREHIAKAERALKP